MKLCQKDHLISTSFWPSFMIIAQKLTIFINSRFLTLSVFLGSVSRIRTTTRLDPNFSRKDPAPLAPDKLPRIYLWLESRLRYEEWRNCWFNKNILWFNFSGHIRKSTIGRPDFANSADLELHATQRPKAAVGGQHKTSQTVVAQLSETQVSCNLNNYFRLQVCLAFVRLCIRHTLEFHRVSSSRCLISAVPQLGHFHEAGTF